MDFIEITAKDNPLIKLASSLQSSSKARNESGLFALEGLRICKDAYENSIRFDKLIITNEAYKKYNTDEKAFYLFAAIASIIIVGLYSTV